MIVYIQLGSYGEVTHISLGRALGVEDLKNSFERVDGGKISVTRKQCQMQNRHKSSFVKETCISRWHHAKRHFAEWFWVLVLGISKNSILELLLDLAHFSGLRRESPGLAQELQEHCLQNQQQGRGWLIQKYFMYMLQKGGYVVLLFIAEHYLHKV